MTKRKMGSPVLLLDLLLSSGAILFSLLDTRITEAEPHLGFKNVCSELLDGVRASLSNGSTRACFAAGLRAEVLGVPRLGIPCIKMQVRKSLGFHSVGRRFLEYLAMRAGNLDGVVTCSDSCDVVRRPVLCVLVFEGV